MQIRRSLVLNSVPQSSSAALGYDLFTEMDSIAGLFVAGRRVRYSNS